MRPDHRHTQRDGQGGIPDGLLVGILAFLLGMTLLVWTATGLASWFAHGSWASGVTFTRTPLAMRALIAKPHDIPAAWPGTPPAELSGYGLFWGLFIGQLMVLVVLTVFVMGTLARWRAVRARRREEKILAAEEQTESGTPALGATAYEAHEPVQHEVPTTAQHHVPPSTQHEVVTAQHEVPTPRRSPSGAASPLDSTTSTLDSTESPAGSPQPGIVPATTASLFGQDRVGRWERILVAPRETRQTTATQAVRDAEGPALIVTSNPLLWQDTKDARAKLGPTHLYDPTHLCDTPS
ncbi:type VI secretion protein, partial [Streptomyces indiaensis]|nr:type VI secretion protein [Streptomyces indiaensis]